MIAAPRIAVLVAAALMLLAPAVAPAQEHDAHVHVIDGGDPFFDPFETVIRVGDTVEWDNHADRLHTVTHVTCKRADARFDDCEFDSVFTLEPGTTFTHTFADRSGMTFDYKCTIHGFTGRITVLGEDGALPDLLVAALAAFDTASPANKRLQATVRNDGAGSAVATKVRFEYQNHDGAWIAIGEQAVPALNAGSSVEINQTWLVANKIGDFPVRATADALGTAVETDDGNNTTDVVVPVWLPPGIAPGVALPDP